MNTDGASTSPWLLCNETRPSTANGTRFILFLGSVSTTSFWNMLLMITPSVFSEVIRSREPLCAFSPTLGPGTVLTGNFVLGLVVSINVGLATEEPFWLSVVSSAVCVGTRESLFGIGPAKGLLVLKCRSEGTRIEEPRERNERRRTQSETMHKMEMRSYALFTLAFSLACCSSPVSSCVSSSV